MTSKRIWTCVLLTTALTVSLATNSAVLGKGKPQPPPEPDLPAVRYRVEVSPPLAGNVFANDINNLGVVVGKIQSDLGASAFIYFPGSGQATDLNTLVAAGIPDGAWLRSGVAINDWMVVVGSMEYSTGEVVGFALDLGAETPVVDLLPDFGSGYSYGTQINENGDILGFADGVYNYFFNPGLYDGDPVVRTARNGLPLDLTEDPTEPLPDDVAGGSWPQLNNPQGSRSAQIVGRSQAGVHFRYTTGVSADLELFPELNVELGVVYLNDSGTFAGLLRGERVKGNNQFDRFRYDQDIELLPRTGTIHGVKDINSNGDLITTQHVYQDEWGAWVDIDDLVVGTPADLANWFSSNAELRGMNDRDGTADAAQIVATTSGSGNNTMFILTPEPAPQ